jgi:ssDNA thymidine ADP-ribosyltransferase DarT-like protein
MPRPQPTGVLHFTRVEHLADIIEHGLLPDNHAQAEGLLTVEIGHTDIKERRRRREVPLGPGGSVADYVPFYFAPRSPMMFAIHCGNVPTYREGCGRLMYLVSSLERLADAGLTLLLTDRNAVLQFATFIDFAEDVPDDFIDWELMRARIWRNTPDAPDRMERRMAECLVHPLVPWDAIEAVGVASESVAEEARNVLARVGDTTQVLVRPQWYF